MENNNLQNKLFKDAMKGVTDITNLAKSSIKTLDQKLQKEMEPKGYARYKAYLKKMGSLTEQGKHVEAAELEKAFRAGE